MSPTYLYIKRHKLTGLLYLGKTIRKDPYKYTGSGKRWLYHIKKHGKDYIETVYCEKFEDVSLLKECAEFLSEIFDIVKSNNWANLIPESGIGGASGRVESEETKIKKSIANTGKKRSIEQCKRISDSHIGLKRSRESLEKFKRSMTGRTHSEETKRRISETSKKRKPTEETIAKMKATKAARKHIPKRGWTKESKENMSIVAKNREAKKRQPKDQPQLNFDPTKPLVVTKTSREAGIDIQQQITGDADTTVTRV